MNQLQKYIQRDAVQAFLLALGYGISFYLLNLFLHQRGMVSLLPGNQNLMHWDSGWYKEVAELGYIYREKGPCNVVFFPLFPIVWKLLPFSAMGISFVNAALFAMGFALFNTLYKLSAVEKLIILSLPPIYFAFIPYSEAVFILCTSASLWAIHHNKKGLLWLSLFLLALSRPVALVMAPAFILAELILNDRNKWLLSLKRSLHYIVPSLAGTFLLFAYQYYTTGVWLCFFIKVVEVWEQKFAIPSLPFNSYHGPRLLWLNAVAMFLCVMALILLVSRGIQWLAKNKVAQNRLLILSCLYMVAVLCKTVFFNPTWGTYTTNVFDINRYVFASPFFWVFLIYFVKDRRYTAIDFLKLLLLTNAFWLLFASYNHIMYVVYFNFCTLMIMLYMMHANGYPWAVAIIFTLNLYVQVQMFQGFIGENIYPG